MAASLHYLTLNDPSKLAKPRHLAYYEWGNSTNSQVALCLHGLTRNGRDFDVLAEALAPRYRVICPDMAGRGKSDWLDRTDDYNYFTYIADINALLKALDLTQIILIGTSMGGIIGMMLAAGQPFLIKRMILNDVGAVVSKQGLTRILGYAGAASEFDSMAQATAYLKSHYASFGLRADDDWQRLFNVTFLPLTNGRFALAYDPGISQPFKTLASQTGVISDIDLSMFWEHVTCPVLILRGAESDILTHETAQAMCIRAQATTLMEFANIGHAPALMSADQIRIVVDWLA